MFYFRLGTKLKKFFYISGNALTPPPFLVAMPLKKELFAASLIIKWGLRLTFMGA